MQEKNLISETKKREQRPQWNNSAKNLLYICIIQKFLLKLLMINDKKYYI